MENQQIWSSVQLADLENKSKMLTVAERKTFHVDFVKNAIDKVPSKIVDETELVQFRTDIELLLTLFPVRDERGKLIGKTYHKAITELKISLQKKYNLVSAGYYIAIFLPLGIAIGMPFGLMMKNIALGIPIGLAIGVAIGSALDQKAKKEGRII